MNAAADFSRPIGTHSLGSVSALVIFGVWTIFVANKPRGHGLRVFADFVRKSVFDGNLFVQRETKRQPFWGTI